MSGMPDVFFDSTGSWVTIEGDCRSHDLTRDQARLLAAQLESVAYEVESGEALLIVEQDRQLDVLRGK